MWKREEIAHLLWYDAIEVNKRGGHPVRSPIKEGTGRHSVKELTCKGTYTRAVARPPSNRTAQAQPMPLFGGAA